MIWFHGNKQFDWFVDTSGDIYSKRKPHKFADRIEELRGGGATYSEIARMLGFTSAASCFKAHKTLRHTTKKLKPFPNAKGYLYLTIDGHRVNVAHVVLEAFVGPKLRGLESAHNNGIKTDNRLGNLRWATHQDNIDDKQLHGTHYKGERNPLSKLSQADVAAIRADSSSQREIAASYGISQSAVSMVKSGKRWSK